jgi:16S rRNA (guanine527-N7)-methyltransferase
MDPARISDLLAPFLRAPLSEIQLRRLSTYLDLLLRWNQRTNLTALRDAESIVTRHFGESLFAVDQLFPHAASPQPLPGAENASPAFPRVVDVGSGAGFPGIPIHISSSSIKSTLVESNNKKVAFLREVCRALTLTSIDVFAGRAENFPSRADVVTLRAVDRFDTVLRVAAALVAPAGRLALLITSAQTKSVYALKEFAWTDPAPVPASTSRIILIGERTAEPN